GGPRMATLAPATLAEHALAAAAPGLLPGFRDALPRAASVVTRRLVGALYREDLAGVRAAPWLGDRLRLSTSDGPLWLPATRHGFGRVEVDLPGEPAPVLADLCERLGSAALAAELADATVHLALAYARRTGADAALRERAGRGRAGAAGGRPALRGADRGAAHAAPGAGRGRPPPLPQAVAGHPGHLDPAHDLGGEHPQRSGPVRAAVPAARRRPGRAPAAAA